MKEKIYDDQISPLMVQILAICKDNKIAMIAAFMLAGDLHCPSSMLTPEHEPSKSQLDAWELLKPRKAFAMAQTTETLPDGNKKITIRRIS